MTHDNENTPADVDTGDINDDDNYFYPETPEEEEEFRLHCEETDRTARALLAFIENQNKEDAIDQVVYSLEMSKADTHASNPVDFSDILTTNSRILNAGFEYYLTHAQKSGTPDDKTELALRMQSQLVRTIEAWSRLKNLENRRTK